MWWSLLEAQWQNLGAGLMEVMVSTTGLRKASSVLLLADKAGTNRIA